MLRSERLKLIMKEINLYNTVLSADLSEKFNVSEDTIRRELEELSNEGLTDSDWEVVQVIKAMIRCAKKVVVVSIAEKLNSVQRLKICDLSEIDYLITELPADSPFLSAFADKKLRII